MRRPAQDIGKIFFGRRASYVQEMGFLVDDRSVIGVSNSAGVASDYKDANVPVEKFRRRGQGGETVGRRWEEEDECGRRKLENGRGGEGKAGGERRETGGGRKYVAALTGRLMD